MNLPVFISSYNIAPPQFTVYVTYVHVQVHIHVGTYTYTYMYIRYCEHSNFSIIHRVIFLELSFSKGHATRNDIVDDIVTCGMALRVVESTTFTQFQCGLVGYFTSPGIDT